MFTIIGIVVVFAAILTGYLMEHGNIAVLLQPAELIIIGGAAVGTVLIGNPVYILKQIADGFGTAFGNSPYSKQRYLESMKMMYELFGRARRDGMMALETDSDNPEQSPIFCKYPSFLRDHHALVFVCDSIRMASSGSVEPFDADQMIEMDMEVHHRGASEPVAALSTVADSLPGLGIVAAVLGVVITMGALGGPPEEIGKKVAAALVGTFLGILLCYGLVGPLSSNLAKAADAEHSYYQVLRVMIIAFMKGSAPTLAIEFGRRAIPSHLRPTFQETEKFLKEKPAAPAAAAAA
ncbi:MAG: flagellar motor stator protein MotA [Candidatus Acidiferrales bacterium]